MELLNEKSEKLATRRTYKLLKAGLFHLLMEMPFEKISLTEICTRSLVPRSTFYRYFEDKHDLLCYCFQTFFDEANLEEDVLYLRNVDSMKEFLWKILRIMEQNRAAIYKIYETNKDGAFMEIFRDFLVQLLTEKLMVSEAKGCRLKISPLTSCRLASFAMEMSFPYSLAVDFMLSSNIFIKLSMEIVCTLTGVSSNFWIVFITST